ncbi:hypothetical protein SAMN04488112_104165 [Melghirimyces thermohalophilus]|uniref:Uncharacterized protein n=2 Tax=Melghirimyces thermohalophilus TaxID=1236220 RepID=A0A1G6JSL9_9BACL|nr:hypothetical protein SAMN04488112_104165 [Melghirimyces thermohalophilus]
MTSVPPRSRRLSSIPLDNLWPHLPHAVLALTELEQDEMYPLLTATAIPRYLEEATAFGREAATNESDDGDLTRLFNRIIQSGVRVRLIEQNGAKGNGWIRAQYHRKPPTIDVYRSSMEQLEQFFAKCGYRVAEEDLIALHLYHEWFHHLESTRLGRTDYRLPKVRKKKWGPLVFRQRVYRLREIAAHAFTQEAMGLTWSPLWLDHLLLLTEKGWTKSQIREHFQFLHQKYQKITESDREART